MANLEMTKLSISNCELFLPFDIFPPNDSSKRMAGEVQMAKTFSYQMVKSFHICKWIFFAISRFAIIKEIAST